MVIIVIIIIGELPMVIDVRLCSSKEWIQSKV